MAERKDTFLDRLRHRRALRDWGLAADGADRAGLSRLRLLRGRARQLRREIDRLLHQAEARLARPMVGADVIGGHMGADWVWRPDLWRGPMVPAGLVAPRTETRLGAHTTLFHDCRDSDMTLRQVRNAGASDLAPFGLALDTLGFDGTFLSLAIDLPGDAVKGLRKRHLVRVEAVLDSERPVKVFLRLNVRHGPNVEQIVRELPTGVTDAAVDFDLGYTNMVEARVEAAWIDVIPDMVGMNRIVLRDLTVGRRLRAEI